MNPYLEGTYALLGDMGTGGAPSVVTDEEYGPLSPEQLSRLGRPLTPAEQKAVNDWIAENQKKKEEDARKQQPKKQQTPKSAAPAQYDWYSQPSRPPAPAGFASVPQGFWSEPLWEGAPIKKWQGAVGGAGMLAIVIAIYHMVR